MKRIFCIWGLLFLLCIIPSTVYASSGSGEIGPKYVGVVFSNGTLDIYNGNCVINGYVQARSGYEAYITATLYERDSNGAWRNVGSWPGVKPALVERRVVEVSYPATYGKEYMAQFDITAYLGNAIVDTDRFYSEVKNAY